MSTQELQDKLIAKIKITQENHILEDVYRLLEFEEDSNKIYKLNVEQEQYINESFEEIKRGEYFSDEDVQKETDEWLKK